MILPASDPSKASDRWSVEEYTRWMRQQSSDAHEWFELIEGQVHSLPTSPELMRLLRLLQWQIQRFFPSPLDPIKNVNSGLTVQVRSSLQLDNFNQLQPAILIRKDCTDATEEQPPLEPSPSWIIDIAEGLLNPLLSSPEISHPQRARLYARAGVLDYWWLDLDSVELHVYQQPSESGYQRYRLLQVGEPTRPTAVPLTLCLREPVPIYFMTRTLKGQQTYDSNALPLSIESDRSLAS